MLTHTAKNPWRVIRSAVATVDWPTGAGNTYDPPGDVTERLVIYMVDTLEDALTPINVREMMAWNKLVFRASFNDNAGTATMNIFAACERELSVKMIAEVTWTAGTQVTADGRYFAKTGVVIPYYIKGIVESDAESNGIATIGLDTVIYDRVWVGFDAISGTDDVTIEVNGY